MVDHNRFAKIIGIKKKKFKYPLKTPRAVLSLLHTQECSSMETDDDLLTIEIFSKSVAGVQFPVSDMDSKSAAPL